MCILETFVDVIKFYSKFENNTRDFFLTDKDIYNVYFVYIFDGHLFQAFYVYWNVLMQYWSFLCEKRACCWDTNQAGRSLLMLYKNLRVYPTEIFMDGFFFFTILFLYKICNKATLRRKYWCLLRLLFSGWYIAVMPFLYYKPFCFSFSFIEILSVLNNPSQYPST